jgi:hypothetical protein
MLKIGVGIRLLYINGEKSVAELVAHPLSYCWSTQNIRNFNQLMAHVSYARSRLRFGKQCKS